MIHRVEKVGDTFLGFIEVRAGGLISPARGGAGAARRQTLFQTDTLYLVYDRDARRLLEVADRVHCEETLADLILDYQGLGYQLTALVVYVTKKITRGELASVQEKHERLELLVRAMETEELPPLSGVRAVELI